MTKQKKASEPEEGFVQDLEDIAMTEEIRKDKKGKIEAFVCTVCGRDIPAEPEVFEEDITEDEIQQIEEMYCPDCCGWFMIPVEGPTFGGGYIVATGETIPPQFPKMKKSK